MKRRRTITGFTIIEMLLVVSLLSMVSISVYQAISNGLKVWKRCQNFTREEDVLVLFEKLEHDLRNACPFSKLEMRGDELKLYFPARLVLREDKEVSGDEVQYAQQLGQVEYSYDAMQQSVMRRLAGYGQALQRTYGPYQRLADSVTGLKFSYLVLQSEIPTYLATFESSLPIAVKVELSFQEDTGGVRTLSRIINLPLGPRPPRKPKET